MKLEPAHWLTIACSAILLTTGPWWARVAGLAGLAPHAAGAIRQGRRATERHTRAN